MDQQVNHQRRVESDKAKKMISLIENPVFDELFMKGFIRDGILKTSIDRNLDNPTTIDELKARQLLNRYIFDIIETGEILKSY